MELAILLAVLYGCFDVVSRMANVQATRYLGTVNGSFLNYFIGALVCLSVVLITGGGQVDLAGFRGAPWWMYLGAVCGLIGFLFMIVGIRRVEVFQSSVLLLLGQLGGSMLLDRIIYGEFTTLELVGILMVAGGIVADKKITSAAPGKKTAGSEH